MNAAPFDEARVARWKVDGQPVADCTPTDCVFDIQGDTTLEVELEPAIYALVVFINDGQGSIVASDPSFSCTDFGLCEGRFPIGSTTTLLATAIDPSQFLGWSGCDANPTPAECVITSSKQEGVQVNFDALHLTLLPIPAGSGEIMVDGQICGAQCDVFLSPLPASTRTFFATPTGGSTFQRWITPCDDEVSSMCTSANAFRDGDLVLALFDPGAILSIDVSAGGHVDVVANGVIMASCPGSTSCNVSITPGTNVTLQATPDPSFVFSQWADPTCIQSDASCDFQVNVDTKVIAQFQAAN